MLWNEPQSESFFHFYGKEHGFVDIYKKICSVDPGSIAEEAGICPGDAIVEINGREIRDILSYKYHAADENITLKIEKALSN